MLNISQSFLPILCLVSCALSATLITRQDKTTLDDCLRSTNGKFKLGHVPWDEDLKKITDNWLSQDRRLKHCPGYNKFPRYGGYCYVSAPGVGEYEVCENFFIRFSKMISQEHPFNTPSACSSRHHENRWYVYCRYAYSKK